MHPGVGTVQRDAALEKTNPAAGDVARTCRGLARGGDGGVDGHIRAQSFGQTLTAKAAVSAPWNARPVRSSWFRKPSEPANRGRSPRRLRPSGAGTSCRPARVTARGTDSGP